MLPLTKLYRTALFSKAVLHGRLEHRLLMRRAHVCVKPEIAQRFRGTQRSLKRHRIFSAVRDGEGQTEQAEGQQRVYYQSVAVDPTEGQPILVHAKIAQPSVLGWIGSMLVVFLVTVGSVAAALTAFVFYLRPALKTFEDTCKATEKASRQLESAAVELEEAAIMFDEKLPPALKSVEAASREFEDLGQSLNSLSGGLLSRRPARHRRREREHHKEHKSEDQETEMALVATEHGTEQGQSPSVPANIRRQTMQSLNKVASDIISFTHNFKPAMDSWRKKLTSIVSTVEAERGASTEVVRAAAPKQLEEPIDAERIMEPNGMTQREAMEGVSIEVRGVSDAATSADDDDYGDISDLRMEDIFKNKDTLIARLSNESTGDVASAIVDALYKAEQAAEDAARASGDLQEVVERARNSADWGDFIAWGDEDASMTATSNEFFEPDYSGSIKYDAAALAESEEGQSAKDTDKKIK